MSAMIIPLAQLRMDQVAQVGGKNASLGEMIGALAASGVRVPGGFATTADAYRAFLAQDGLTQKIHEQLDQLDIEDVKELSKTGAMIRNWIIATPFPPELAEAMVQAYRAMSSTGDAISVAVRSSATAEDLPDASFAGQQETFLNIVGEDALLIAVKEVYASLYNDRAIAYRVHQGFTHSEVALSAGIQQMVRSDIGASGVMFTLDTESGYQDAVFITASYGLGETIVQGAVNPDEYYVYKPALRNDKFAILRKNLGEKAIRMVYDETSAQPVRTESTPLALRNRFALTDADIQALAKIAMTIEQHYGRHMDIEWAKDGVDQQLYIVQARPETVQSRSGKVMEQFVLKQTSEVLITGRSIGQRIGSGNARVIMNIKEMDRVQAGDVLVTDMTDPDWEPIMKRAAAIITNRGGRTCHAAIIARELGIPAVVGCNDATQKIKDDMPITVSCAQGDTGFVYSGKLDYEVRKIEMDSMPDIPVKIMMNVGNPDRAFDFAAIPNAGVGLARLEFIINRMIGVHPKALLGYAQLPIDEQQKIDQLISGYPDPVQFYIDKLAEGIATIAAPFAPKPVIIRCSDFKSNEYANMLGGKRFEPVEENPMLGFRGASRYIDAAFRDCFELECKALRKVRETMGLTNIQVMIPFVRTVAEGTQVLTLLEEYGLKQGVDDLKVYMMCEIPSNVLLADQFLQIFDGFSIGSNDLTQLTLGLDRDSALVAGQFDERNDAVKKLLHEAIAACKRAGKYVGICGQGPSDHPDLAQWLLSEGIESMSLNPDTVVETWMMLAKQDA